MISDIFGVFLKTLKTSKIFFIIKDWCFLKRFRNACNTNTRSFDKSNTLNLFFKGRSYAFLKNETSGSVGFEILYHLYLESLRKILLNLA